MKPHLEIEMLTIKDICKEFQISRTQFWRLRANQEFPEPIMIGGAQRWTRESVDRWIGEQS